MIIENMAKTLSSVVGPILDPLPGIGLDYQCHSATLYWLCQAQFERAPTGAEMLEASGIIRALLQFGAVMTKLSGNFSARPGTVLVFKDHFGAPKHSCVAISNTVLGGYNQQNWFAMSGPEARNKYTTYLQSQIRWVTPRTVQGNVSGSSCELIGINDVSALGNLQTAINQALSQAH